MEKKKLLVLDIDGTLIYSVPGYKQLEDYDFDILDNEFKIKMRPNLLKFLEKCYELFDIAIWTAATKNYAEAIVENIFIKKPEFVFHKDHCTFISQGSYSDDKITIKDLKKIKSHNIKDIIILDDNEETFGLNKENGIYIKEFLGELNDNELLKIIEKLENLK